MLEQRMAELEGGEPRARSVTPTKKKVNIKVEPKKVVTELEEAVPELRLNNLQSLVCEQVNVLILENNLGKDYHKEDAV